MYKIWNLLNLKYHNPQLGLIDVKYNKMKHQNPLLIKVRSLTTLKPRLSLNIQGYS